MPYVIECPEWHVLQTLGLWVRKRKSRFERKPVVSNDSPLDGLRREINGELFEVELLTLFLLNDGSRVISAPELEECTTALKSVCNHLDTLVHPTVPALAPSPQGQLSSYPRLQHLVGLLADSRNTFDLVCGSNTPLFKLSENIEELEQSLALVAQSSRLLKRLLTLSSSDAASYSRPAVTRPEKRDWENSWLRGRATAAFAALSKHSKCGKAHGRMLKLPPTLDGDGINTVHRAAVDLLISSCWNNWLAVQYGQGPLL